MDEIRIPSEKKLGGLLHVGRIQYLYQNKPNKLIAQTQTNKDKNKEWEYRHCIKMAANEVTGKMINSTKGLKVWNDNIRERREETR